MEELPQDIWTDFIAPRLLVRDVVALSMVSKSLHRSAHTITRTKEPFVVEDSTANLETLRVVAKSWPCLEGSKARLLDCGGLTATGERMSIDQYEENLRVVGTLPVVDIVGLYRLTHFEWVTPAVKSLYLRNLGWFPMNTTSGGPMRALCRSMQKWSAHLTTLHFQNGSTLSGLTEEFLEALASLTHLTDLSLIELHIFISGTEILCKVLPQLPLIHLDVSENSMPEVSLKLFFKTLVDKKTLKTLNITKCGHGFREITELQELLMGDTEIETLIMGDCEFDAVDRVGQALITNTTLKSLKAINVKASFPTRDIKNLVNAMKITGTLTTLEFFGLSGYNSRDTKEMKIQLISALAENESIRYFAVEACALDEGTGEHLAKVLRKNRTLISLNVSQNDLFIEELTQILEPLKHENTTLKSLDLSGMREGDALAKVVADVLKTNKTLVRLNLNQCDISAEGGHVIADSLATNTTLVYLGIKPTLSNISGTQKVLSAFQEAFPDDPYFASKVNPNRPSWVDF